ncbi:hypothetical protein ACNKHW_01535 [Shigella flexneri]
MIPPPHQASAKKLANNIETAIAKQATEMGSLVVHDERDISHLPA